MPSYSPPVKDTLFVLNNVLHLERYTNLPGFAGAEPEMVEAILTEGGRFCAEVIQPTTKTGDRAGCTRTANGSVTTPSGFKQAYDQLVAGAWPALPWPERTAVRPAGKGCSCTCECRWTEVNYKKQAS